MKVVSLALGIAPCASADETKLVTALRQMMGVLTTPIYVTSFYRTQCVSTVNASVLLEVLLEGRVRQPGSVS